MHICLINKSISVIPKQNSIFTLAVPLHSTLASSSTGAQTPLPTPSHAESGADVTTVLDKPYLEFELYGNQFCYRSAERAGRKFKAKDTIEL